MHIFNLISFHIIYLLFNAALVKGTYAYGSGFPFFLMSPPAFDALYSAPGMRSVFAFFNDRCIPDPPAKLYLLKHR